ncbi:MAG: type II toxin-antitoxin system VapC family toxin [Dehalococcoidales bacterium]|nr:type II toxin-antitoxin system VapC family toxin [Dehalococcoidales bacterium]
MICVDASLAAKWIFPEDYSLQALALLSDNVEAKERIVAPPLLSIELANVIRQRMLRKSLTLDDAKRLLNQFWSLSIAVVAPAMLSEEALVIAHDFNLPAVYDAHYVALARMLGCDLWTNDQRLLRTLENRLPFVKWIGDYRSGQPRGGLGT